MSRDHISRESVQTLLADANPVPDSAVTDSWRDSAGRATYQAIVRTPPDESRAGGRSRSRQVARHSRAGLPRKGFVIGTAVVAASVAAGLVISGVPSRLLGSTGTTRPPTGISKPTGPTVTTTWPKVPTKTAKGTAPMLHYVLAGAFQPSSVTGLPPARAVLLKLASAAEHRTPLPQPSGARISFVVSNEWFFSTAVSGGTSSSVSLPEVDKTWFAPNGASRLLSHRGRPIVIVAGSPKNLRAAEYGKPTADERRGPGNTNDGPLVGTLSLDPAALKRQLLHADEGGAPLAIRLFETITQVHHQIVSAQLDAAMWRVLATQSDVRSLGRVTDRAGRAGEAVAFTERSGSREVLIISPTTGQLLGFEDLILHGASGLHLTAYPAVVGYTIFLSEHWTKTMNGNGK
ncbi:MAG TPA: hypothetical protein VFI65_27740 [Streptosporangiaceae bacterium]|nr:hypothetical protein [Streptosporangiaceae bacterium]